MILALQGSQKDRELKRLADMGEKVKGALAMASTQREIN